MTNKIQTVTQETITKALDFVYEKSLCDFPGMESAQSMADSYANPNKSLIENAKELRNWQIAKAGTAGFLAGLPGLLAMPVTLPANITAVMYVQIRMITAIAIMSGYDVKDDRVKTAVFSCVAASSAADVVKAMSVNAAKIVAKNIITKIPGSVLTKINQQVGFRLFTKFGQTGLVNLGKAVPVLGGVIGGTFDAVWTKKVGSVAIDLFAKQAVTFQ